MKNFNSLACDIKLPPNFVNCDAYILLDGLGWKNRLFVGLMKSGETTTTPTLLLKNYSNLPNYVFNRLAVRVLKAKYSAENVKIKRLLCDPLSANIPTSKFLSTSTQSIGPR